MQIPADFLGGFLVVSGLTALSIVSRKIDIPGAIAGFLLTLAMFLGASWYGIVLLTSFFVLGTLASVWKRKEKEAMALAQEKGGKRGIINALSNGAVAGITGLLAWIFPETREICILMMTASLAAATSDTLSSELGNVYGKRYWDILSWKPGQKGNDGIISLEGSMAGVFGAACISMLFGAFFGWEMKALAIIFLSGLIGNLLDSILGASLQRRGLMNNHAVNFWNTVGAGVFSLALAL